MIEKGVEAGRVELPSKAKILLVSTCLVWLLCLALKLVANNLHSGPVRKFLSRWHGHPPEPAHLN